MTSGLGVPQEKVGFVCSVKLQMHLPFDTTNYLSCINMLRILRRLPGSRLINFTYDISLINERKYFVISWRLCNP